MANFGPWEIREVFEQKIKAFSLELVKSKMKPKPTCEQKSSKKVETKMLPPLKTPSLRPRVCLTEENQQSFANERVYNFISESNKAKMSKLKCQKNEEKYKMKQHVYPDVLIQISHKHSNSFARMRQIRKEAASERLQIFRIWNAFKPYKVKRRLIPIQ